jgi:phosphatidylserine/phosphatidylglycerophosphate/cardiolipin synthase-like enzyme
VASRADSVKTAFDDVFCRIDRPEGVRRLGQALWMMVGRTIELPSLIWARSLLGVDGDVLLWKALSNERCFVEPGLELAPQQLCTFLCRLWGGLTTEKDTARLVWTLPEQLVVEGVERNGYARAAIQLVAGSQSNTKIISPYLEPRGMGLLHESLTDALRRSVEVVLITRDVEDHSSLASASLATLRREGSGLPGILTVFTAVATMNVLMHQKIVDVDGAKALVGSGNITGKAFNDNLETGVVLGRQAATEIDRVVAATIASGLVTKVFSTGNATKQ